uniref:Isoform 2 of Ribosomal operon-associated A protein n=1 Tax=Euglena gracilis TaxID=3039 RepID=P30397-2|nr:RoaA protein [Euglena gracilis]
MFSFFYRFNWNFIKWNDNTVSLTQHKIYLASKKSDIFLVKNKQRRFFKSFYAHIFSVRNCFEKFPSLQSYFYSSKDKFFLVSLLSSKRNLFLHGFFYNIKKAFLFYSYDFFLLYKLSFSLLLTSTLLPYINDINPCFIKDYYFFVEGNFFDFEQILIDVFKYSYYFKVENFKFLYFARFSWIYKNFPLDVNFLKNFLDRKNLVFFKSLFLIIFNFIFNGLNFFFQENFFISYKVYYLFYIDKFYFFFKFPYDFFICKKIIISFFSLRGIILNININSFYRFETFVFNFFIFDFLRFGSNILLHINKKHIQFYKLSLKMIVKMFLKKSVFFLVNLLNKKILDCLNRGFFCFNNNFLFLELDLYLYRLLWRYIKKLHSRKTRTWIYSKYWKFFSGIWRFFITDIKTGNFLFLKSHLYSSKYFYSYRNMKFKISNTLNIFNLYNKGKLERMIFEKFKYKFSPNFIVLYNNQRGLCFFCKKSIYSNRFVILNIKKWNFSFFENLILIHFYCNNFNQLQ